jgi:hypothetical protein
VEGWRVLVGLFVCIRVRDLVIVLLRGGERCAWIDARVDMLVGPAVAAQRTFHVDFFVGGDRRCGPFLNWLCILLVSHGA